MKHHHLIAFGGCIARRRCPDPTSYGGRHHQARVTPPEHQQHLMCASPSDSSDNSACDRSVDQRLCELMSPSPGVKPEQMNTSSLAYIGDVVFELFVRSRYVWPNRRMSDLQNKVSEIFSDIPGYCYEFSQFGVALCFVDVCYFGQWFAFLFVRNSVD